MAELPIAEMPKEWRPTLRVVAFAVAVLAVGAAFDLWVARRARAAAAEVYDERAELFEERALKVAQQAAERGAREAVQQVSQQLLAPLVQKVADHVGRDERAQVETDRRLDRLEERRR